MAQEKKKEKKYRVGLKLQGDYKGKSLKGKLKESLKTAGKQIVGTAKAVPSNLNPFVILSSGYINCLP